MDALPAQLGARPVEVVVAGPITRDTAVLVDALPEPGGSVLAGAARTLAGGKAGTPAVLAAGLGAHVRLLGAVGTDRVGDDVLDELRGEGVDVSGVARVDAGTGQILHLVEPGGQRRYIEAAGANDHVRDLDAGTCDAVLLSTALPLERFEHRAALVVVDAAGAPEVTRTVIDQADVLRADAEEASALAGSEVGDWESAEAAARALGVRVAIVQAPGCGDVVVSPDGVLRLPLHDVDAVDPTGAGDAFVATLTVMLARGETLADAARAASEAAARAVTVLGAR